MALAVALVLYDNFMIGIRPYYTDPKLRRKINQDRLEHSGKLSKIADNYLAWSNLIKMKKAIKLFEKERNWMKSEASKHFRRTKLGQRSLNNPNKKYLNKIISSSYSYDKIKDTYYIKHYFDRVTHRQRKRFDIYNMLKSGATNSLSMAFGNLVGLYEKRKGKLYNKPEVTKKIASQLKPLDILLEKTPFRLTDTFIPGHWGHIAIWLGTPEELQAIQKNGVSVWDSISVEQQNNILQGKRVLEALRPGVMMNTLDHFMNVDDFASMRKSSELSEEDKFDYLMSAFAQVGKKYDFNFDVNTDNKIVCSEIVYKVFYKEEWPTENTLNRWTISPDHVAMKSTGADFEYSVTSLYSDGIEISPLHYSRRYVMEMLLEYSYDWIEKAEK